ncbi:unnamed protein product [Dracunculus medinensis]|uniref:Uncharacterized protein n=1 Tax=Dracunculus medinensis TaxID=318479 RepID=A0A0N4UBI7_DRAME|nr:unnamed protein product [Dracunculus medinensis]
MANVTTRFFADVSSCVKLQRACDIVSTLNDRIDISLDSARQVREGLEIIEDWFSKYHTNYTRFLRLAVPNEQYYSLDHKYIDSSYDVLIQYIVCGFGNLIKCMEKHEQRGLTQDFSVQKIHCGYKAIIIFRDQYLSVLLQFIITTIYGKEIISGKKNYPLQANNNPFTQKNNKEISNLFENEEKSFSLIDDNKKSFTCSRSFSIVDDNKSDNEINKSNELESDLIEDRGNINELEPTKIDERSLPLFFFDNIETGDEISPQNENNFGILYPSMFANQSIMVIRQAWDAYIKTLEQKVRISDI